MKNVTLTKIEFNDGSVALITLMREVIEDSLNETDGIEKYSIPARYVVGVNESGEMVIPTSCVVVLSNEEHFDGTIEMVLQNIKTMEEVTI